MGITVSASEFKAKCLEYFDKLARHELDSIEITKRGKKVAVVWPPKPTHEEALASHGFMRGCVIMPEGFDLTAPTGDIEEWDAAHGVLHQ